MRSARTILILRFAGFCSLVWLSSLYALAQGDDRHPSNSSLTDPAYAKIIVAEVGTMRITAQEFLLSYGFGPAFAKRRQDSKRSYLDFMINEKLFALEGYARGLQHASRAREALREIEGDLATEELYKRDVATRVSVSQKDVEDAMPKKRTSIALEWLFAPSESGIAAAEQRLRGGTSFDSLYALQLRSGASADDRSLRTTQFDLQMKNSVLARIADSLTVGAVSLPIHVDDGWYVVRVIDRETDAIVTETDAEAQREDVRRALVERASDRLSDEYVNQIIIDAKATIERRPFDILQAHLASQIVPHDRFAEWDMAGLLARKWGPLAFDDIEPIRNQTLVTCRRGKLTVADFLRWYDARSTGIRLATTSARAFFASFEGVLWRMVRDTLLVERAFKRRLQLAGTVQQQRKWWEEKIVYELSKSMIADSIPVDTPKLQAYYQRHERDFRDSTGATAPFERAADDVRRAYYASALTERMLHRLLTLKERYSVTVHSEALDRLSVEGQNDPGAIDVYAVKKGGTFPRPAFPTIDIGWQAWN